jgi:hypothetical protein
LKQRTAEHKVKEHAQLPQEDPRTAEIITITRRLARLAPSSLDLLLAIVRDLYEHGALREEVDGAADVGKEP